METFKKTATAVLFLFTTPAFADGAGGDEAETKETKPVAPLERTLIVPDVIGLRIGSSPALAGATGLSGIVSYSYNDGSASNGRGSHAEAFGINPSFDVRAGRFTVGGVLRFTHLYNRIGFIQGTDGESRAFSLQLVPRVGVLIPILPHVTFWPRVGVGAAIASSQFDVAGSSQRSTSAGVVASADALIVVDLGSRFFVSGGPTVNFSHMAGKGDLGADQQNTSFQAAASVAMGVAF